MDRERRDGARALFDDLPAADLDSFVAVADHVLAQLTPPGGPSTGKFGDQPDLVRRRLGADARRR